MQSLTKPPGKPELARRKPQRKQASYVQVSVLDLRSIWIAQPVSPHQYRIALRPWDVVDGYLPTYTQVYDPGLPAIIRASVLHVEHSRASMHAFTTEIYASTLLTLAGETACRASVAFAHVRVFKCRNQRHLSISMAPRLGS